MLPGPRPTSVPSGILIYPAVWPQHTRAENWGEGCALFGELGPHVPQCRLGQGLYLRTKWHLDLSSRLATIDMGRKLGAVPLWGELVPHLTQRSLRRGLSPYLVVILNRLATIHQRHRQADRQTGRQRSDSIGRTVSQTVAQNAQYCWKY